MFFIPHYEVLLLKKLALTFSSIIILYNLILILYFNKISFDFQFIEVTNIFFSILDLNFVVGVDGLSLLLILLTSYLIFFCILVSWTSILYKLKDFLICLFLIQYLLFNVFAVLDIFLFYIFFESLLIPMFILVGIWGSRSRRIHASYQFFLYTLLGSLIMLVGFFVLYLHVGSTSWFVILNSEFPFYKEIFIWLTFFCSFAVKIPVIPVHIWLPEAHVEAPTAGSVLLAGILLKMGSYAFLRFLLPFFPLVSEFFIPFIFTISIVSIVYSSFTTVRQIDLKKIIAYSSVAHMNFVTLGLFSFDLQGLEGSIFLMLGHGLVSSALFVTIGVLYERYHTRLLYYYGGLVFGMPIFSFFFFFLSICNISFPGTINFVGEFLILISTFSRSIFTVVLALIGVVLGAVYSMWLFNRIVFGILKSKVLFFYSDLNLREFFILSFFSFFSLLFGLYPTFILSFLHTPVLNILNFFI